MKSLLRFFLGLWLIVGAACATAPQLDETTGMYAFPVGTDNGNFRPGDSIVVTKLLASSSKPAVGDKIIVQGSYHLQSESAAKLLLTVSTTRRVSTPILPSQSMQVTAGSGEFQLIMEPSTPGTLHLAFYPGSHSGSSFGGIHFGPEIR